MSAPEGLSCPICGKPQEPRLRPFCSRRCANIDLSRWLKGLYAVPSEETEDSIKDAGPDEEA
jgi:endogenous inhibitor of DNA gyrase (YacG/DUF329 family)